MPIITIVMPNVQWEATQIVVFRVGHFIDALIKFLIIVLVIIMLVKLTTRIGLE